MSDRESGWTPKSVTSKFLGSTRASRAFLNWTVSPTTKRRAAGGREAVTIGTGLKPNLPRNRGNACCRASGRQLCPPLPLTAAPAASAHLRPPRPRTRHSCPLAAAFSETFQPSSSTLPTPRTSAASTWSSGSLPGLLGPPSWPELIPATVSSRPQPGIQEPPTLHPPPFLLPFHPQIVLAPPRRIGGRTEPAGRRRGRLAPASAAVAPPSRSVPEWGSSSTSPAPQLCFRPASPQARCARVPGSTFLLAGSTSRARPPTHGATRTSTCLPYRAPMRDPFLAHPRRAGARPRSA